MRNNSSRAPRRISFSAALLGVLLAQAGAFAAAAAAGAAAAGGGHGAAPGGAGNGGPVMTDAVVLTNDNDRHPRWPHRHDKGARGACPFMNPRCMENTLD